MVKMFWNKETFEDLKEYINKECFNVKENEEGFVIEAKSSHDEIKLFNNGEVTLKSSNEYASQDILLLFLTMFDNQIIDVSEDEDE